MSKFKLISLAAGFSLAMAFTFIACSSGSVDNVNVDGGTSSETNNKISSSSIKNSCSKYDEACNTELYQYCYGYSNHNGYSYRDCNLIGGMWIIDVQDCFSGGGILVNTSYCNENGIAIDNTPGDNSSSSIGNSSSSSVSSSSSSSSSSASLCTGFTEGTTREHYGQQKAQFCDERDGKKYVYTQIGNQTWMAENLNYAASDSRCGSTLSGTGSAIEADAVACDAYGRLYNWATAYEVCPKGWYLPSDEEWNALENTVGGRSNAGTKLKTTSGWTGGTYTTIDGTDEYGFSALPGGYGYIGSLSGGILYNVGVSGYWWSATQINDSYARYWYMSASNRHVSLSNDPKSYLYSVRCVRDSSVPSSSSVVSSSSSSFVVPSSSSVAPSSSSVVPSSSSIAPSSSSVVPSSSSVASGTFTDSRDNKTYKWVKIGTQTWMAENLNYDATGSRCVGTSGTSGVLVSSGGRCDTYGRLYNWNTAMAGTTTSSANPSGRRGVCPAGWHLPSDAEWDVLYRFVDVACHDGDGWGYCEAGSYLKTTSGWSTGSAVSGNGTDKYGFSALPGGRGSADPPGGYGNFNEVGRDGNWWSATESSTGAAYSRNMSYYDERANWNSRSKSILYSVRCVQD
jgi:uncharacterized protein (TIGR02145 family)